MSMSATKTHASSSDPVEMHRGWLALWEVDVPNKVKIHAGRLIKNRLAVGTELLDRRIKEGVFCTRVFNRKLSQFDRPRKTTTLKTLAENYHYTTKLLQKTTALT